MNKIISIVSAALFVVNLLAMAAPAQEFVPNIVGLDESEAEIELDMCLLTLGSRTYACDNMFPAGIIISQSPEAWDFVDWYSSVDVVISTGPCSTDVEVPDVVGMNENDAGSALSAVSLTVGSCA
ncbi:MAG: hypothetical protein PVH77_06500 [Phycisphaerales bacterium]|jgi:beta-lactam-binding protein with PASTA domain